MKKKLVKALSTVFPTQVTNFAYKQLTNPQIKKLRPHELEVLDQAKKEKYAFYDFEIQTYVWEGGSDRVLLIHGWEGQAGNFADLVTELVKKNYTVYAFDGPSHGFSSIGKTSLFEFTELVGELIRKFDVSKLVSHSFGGVATTYALHSNPDLKIKRYVLLATPDKFTERIDDVSAQVGISKKVKNNLISRLENEISRSVENLNVSEFVKNLSVEKALIIHDKNDGVIPINRSKNVFENWGACEFLEIEGTGHFRILRTPFVLDKTIDFLNG